MTKAAVIDETLINGSGTMRVAALLDQVIEALTNVDAARIELLLTASQHIITTPDDIRDALPKQQVLEYLLRETGRNLRMLRRIEVAPEQLLRYGPRQRRRLADSANFVKDETPWPL